MSKLETKGNPTAPDLTAPASKRPYLPPSLTSLGDVATITKAEYGDLSTAKYGDIFGSRTI